ncbi:hypothetical protein RHGRI_015943 [Rhododendron griersonianum]|uniref:Secreted protein n=1 Tax=Rhododendron griersonianum TaxID=479676 RepID=A0AAV6JQP4_9ERIC|nr:hypothetical protein RHGRI_015943 [Rhododendron griersonianum]
MIRALALVAANLFLTRLFHHSSSSLSFCHSSSAVDGPRRGYGSQLSFHIYIYDDRARDWQPRVVDVQPRRQDLLPRDDHIANSGASSIVH